MSNDFEGWEVISTYTADQAIEDGGLIPTDLTFQPLHFAMGRIVMTPGVFDLIAVVQEDDTHIDQDRYTELQAGLARHSLRDWGMVSHGDKAANDAALRDGSRLLSAYFIGTTKVWVVTEADRSLTTVLLPEEY